MADEIDEWRPEPPLRLFLTFFAVGWLAASIAFAVSAAVEAADGHFDAWVLAGAVAAAGLCAICLGYAVRYRIVLAGGELVVVNLWRTHRFPVGLVIRARSTSSGIVFVLADGRRCFARAVEASRYRLWLNLPTRADDVITEVLAAAEQARGAVDAEATPAGIAPTRSQVRRAPAWQRQLLRFVPGVLAMAGTLYVTFHFSHSNTSTSAPRFTLKVGDCMQDPSSPSGVSMAVIACSTPHTAQVYEVNAPANTSCDSGVLDQGALPAGTSNETLTLDRGGFDATLCLVITPPIDHSLLSGPSPSS